MSGIEFIAGWDWFSLTIYAALAMRGTGGLTLRSAARRTETVWPEEPPPHGRERTARPVLAARNLRKAYRTPSGEVVEVRQNVNIEIPGRGLTALIGPSGTGKSTLLNLFGGLDTPDRGQVLFGGQPLPGRECDDLPRYRAQRIAFVFQELNLITHLTAEQNVALPLLRQGLPRGRALAQARDGLQALGIPARLARRRPAQLSGGERQRVAIARAMVADADLVLADEPTGSLDPEHAEDVMKNLRRLVDERDIPVVLVTHNLELAKRYADLVLELGPGGAVCRRQGDSPLIQEKPLWDVGSMRRNWRCCSTVWTCVRPNAASVIHA